MWVLSFSYFANFLVLTALVAPGAGNLTFYREIATYNRLEVSHTARKISGWEVKYSKLQKA